MITFLRRYSQTLMLFVAIIVILSFVTFYNRCTPEMTAGNFVAEAAGNRLTRDDFLRYMRLFDLAQDMGLDDFVQAMAVGPTRRPEQDFVFNLLTLRHSASRLGLEPTAEQLREVQLALSVFQNEAGAFDPTRLARFIETSVTPRGFTERQIDELVRDLISFQTMRRLIGATVPVSPAEAEAALNRRETRHSISFIRFSLDEAKKGIAPSDEEVAKLYEAQKSELKRDEQFQVRIATLNLTPEQTKMQGRDRVLMMQVLANRIYEFSQAAIQPNANFEKLAADYKLEITTTGTFTPSNLDPALQTVPEAENALIGLNPQSPVSDVLQGENSFHVLQLLAYEASRPMTLEEAHEKLVVSLIERQAAEKLRKNAEIERIKLEETMRAGKDLASAAKELGLTVETIPSFTLADPPTDNPDLRSLFEIAVRQPVGAVSPMVPVESGGLLAVVTKREPPSEDVRKEQAGAYATRLERRRKEAAFVEWMRVQRDALGARFLATDKPAAG